MTYNKIFAWRSLKTRVTLFTPAIFVISIWSLALYARGILRENMRRLVGEEQFATVSLLAHAVNAEFNARFTALELFARAIDAPLLNKPALLQKHVEEHPALRHLFNAGVFVTGLDGTAIVEAPIMRRVGRNYMDRDHIAAALVEGKSTIGKPVIGKNVTAPSFAMTVPIHNAHGKVIAALTGATDLSKANFLQDLTQSGYGKSGGYRIVAPQYGLVVAATANVPAMQELAAPGVSGLNDSFIAGYEGSGTMIDASGVEVLASAKRIPRPGWFISAILPTEEAFAPIRATRYRLVLATMFLTLLAGGG